MTPVNPTANNAGYVIANATTQSDPFITFYSLRDPTSNDVNFPIQKRWVNFTFPREWILEKFNNSTGQLQAVWVLLAEGGSGVLSLSDDVGTKVFPDSTGNIQIEGQLNEQTGFFATTVSDPTNHLIKTNPMSGTRWIVDPLSTPTNPNGTSTTIAGVNAQAQAGDTVLIMPGTYTENPTWIAGVNYTGMPGDSLNSNVIINGKSTFSTTGTFILANMTLQTNSDFSIAITGSAAITVNLYDCNIKCTNNTGIDFTNSSASSALQLTGCIGDTGTTGISLWTMSSAGRLSINYSNFNNSGSTLTPSTCSSGSTFINYTTMISTIQTSGTAFISINDSIIAAGPSGNLNQTALTCNGVSPSGASSAVASQFFSRTASAISVGTGSSLVLSQTAVNSTNTNAIVGLGSIVISGISSPSNSALNITTSTVVCAPFNGGRYEASVPISGNATLVNGTVAVALATIASNDMVILSRFSANASTTLGELTYSTSANTSFTVNSLIVGTPASIQTGDQSSFTYFIVRQV